MAPLERAGPFTVGVNMGELLEQGNGLIVIDDNGNRVRFHKTAPGVFHGGNVGFGGLAPGDGHGDNPGAISARSLDGQLYSFSEHQMLHATNVYNTAMQYPGITDKAIRIAFITCIVESQFKQYANPVYPESFTKHYDATASDTDSVGLFQQRPSAGWGTVAQCMDDAYSTKSFLGGPNGVRNGGSPRGLYDIGNWSSLSDGAAAQAVQVSAHPGRYANVVPVANTLIQAIVAKGRQ